MAKAIEYLVIHCTATPENRIISSDDIRLWHLSPKPKGRGWKQVGYTDMFHIDGTVERLVKNNDDAYVDGWEITNGAVGVNDKARHIVYVGGLDVAGKQPKDTRTAAQNESLKKYVLNFYKRFPKVRIVGHNELAAKACPSFDVQAWLKSIGIKQ
jgi:hypothetical protein